MNSQSYNIKAITPIFSRGAIEESPEIRASSIRGQLHWWHRALGYSFAEECEIYGSIKSPVRSSKIIIRVSDIVGQTKNLATLPHKAQKAAKQAYASNTTFILHTLERLSGLSTSSREIFNQTVKAWLLMGSLGLRTTRGAGSLLWDQTPNDEKEYLTTCQELIKNKTLLIDLLAGEFETADDARIIISDTLAAEAFEGSNTLGTIKTQRKTSPLRFKIIPFDDIYKILAIWDNREYVTNNTKQDLRKAIDILASNKKEIGTLLKNSNLYRS